MEYKEVTGNEMDYLKDLKWKSDHIKDNFQRMVFWIVCRYFQLYKQGFRTTKSVPKEDIIRELIKRGLMEGKPDGKLPDDRKVRAAARELLQQGLPIVATSNSKGYYIVEKVNELDLPQNQNHRRAEKILAVDKGYNEIRSFLTNGRLFK